MDFELQIVGYGVFAPLIVAATACLLIARLAPIDLAVRHAIPGSIIAGFVAAYAMFPWTTFRPQTHWQYLPYLVLAGGLIGAVGAAGGVMRVERWLLHALFALVAAWLLVPDWKNLEASRVQYTALVALATLILALSLDGLGARAAPLLVLATVGLTFAAGAVIVGLAGIMKLAQLTGACAAATGGCFIGVWLSARRPAPHTAALSFAVLFVGLMFSGYVNSFSNIPATSYALVPTAVVVAALVELVGSRLRPRLRAILEVVLVMALLAAALLLALRSEA